MRKTKTYSLARITYCICLSLGIIWVLTPAACTQEVSSNIRGLLSTQGKVVFGDEPNSIIVIDYPENIDQVATYLEKLDVPAQQVLIEARVVEVKLQKEHSLGVNWMAFADKGYFPIGRFKTGTSSTLGAPPTPIIQNIPYKPTFYPPGQILTTAESPFSFAIFDDNINIILQTLASSLNTNILSAPKVVTVNNHEAEIKVVQRQPWAEPTITPSETQGTPPSISWTTHYEEVGIKLKATPTINENGDITMLLFPEVSEKISDYTLTASSGGSNQTYTIPIIDTRVASTKVIVKDGQTLIIGGMIKDKVTKGETKIPLLGDLPYFGHLFRSEKDIHDKTELLIFVSPKIITSDDVMHMAKEEKILWDKDYLKQRQKQKEAALGNQEEKKIKDAQLNAKLDSLIERQKNLVNERKKLETAILQEEKNQNSFSPNKE